MSAAAVHGADGGGARSIPCPSAPEGTVPYKRTSNNHFWKSIEQVGLAGFNRSGGAHFGGAG
jgi:hypothetical protein